MKEELIKKGNKEERKDPGDKKRRAAKDKTRREGTNWKKKG